MFTEKTRLIRQACAPIIGRTIERFETAELFCVDGKWVEWPDLPLRLYCSGPTMLAVSWSRFDDLWLANDLSLPFAVDDATTRWQANMTAEIMPAIGCTIQGVSLGRGQMSIESREFEIWTRLVFDLQGTWLEVFNALDENGYTLHEAKPVGEFVDCI